MPDEQPTHHPSAIEPDQVAGEVFRLLVDRYPALVPIDELTRELTFPGKPEISSPPMVVTEAVDRLYHLGLAHRIESFAFATRAGVCAIELWS